MENVDEIIARFGGLTKLAEALGHNQASKVAYWKKVGKIPRWNIHDIKQAARKKRIKVSDLLDE